ncbi:MAG TPA: hypothetical protein VFK50_12060, partial [Sphingomicrobium sp.]|nr:hypothetical protein [Sphingomicrobium sp.]
MDHYSLFPDRQSPLGDRINSLWDRGVRLARRVAIAFGLSTLVAIWVGAALTNNGFAQIFVTVLAALGLWVPTLFLVFSVERFFQRFRRQPASGATIDVAASPAPADQWQRLAALAPGQRDRLNAIRRSLETSRTSLGSAELNPGARDLCVLI